MSGNAEVRECCLCGREFKGWGNNPAPLRDKGVCCDECNGGVILARMAAYAALVEQGKMNADKKGGTE